jgi:copper chaperone CopZ
VKRILGRMDGVSEVVTDVPAQAVTVRTTGAADSAAMLAALKKWGEPAGKVVELAA